MLKNNSDYYDYEKYFEEAAKDSDLSVVSASAR